MGGPQVIPRVGLAILVLVVSTAWSSSAAGRRPTCMGERATIVGEGYIEGTQRDDVIVGSDNSDRILGLGGDDLICARDGAPTLSWEYIYGGRGRDRISGGRGGDWILGQGGSDDLRGGEGLDVLEGHGGDDVLRGGTGSDGLSGFRGDDLLLGGPHFDGTGFGNAPGGIRADLSKGVATGWGRDRLVSIESLYGSNQGSNVLIGDGKKNVIFGGARDDVIEAGDGDDFVDGKGGNDRIDGERGVDRIEFPDETEIGDLMVGVDVDLAAGRATMGPHTDHLISIEDIEGTEYGDVLRGDPGPNRIEAGFGTDHLEGRAGDDWLDAGFESGESIDGGDGHDRCSGADTRNNCEDYPPYRAG